MDPELVLAIVKRTIELHEGKYGLKVMEIVLRYM